MDDDVILRCLELATKAPTGGNSQNWHWVVSRDAEVKRKLARRALGLPFSVQPCAVIPVGWPQGRYGPTTRRTLEKVVSFDRWGGEQGNGA